LRLLQYKTYALNYQYHNLSNTHTERIFWNGFFRRPRATSPPNFVKILLTNKLTNADENINFLGRGKNRKT